MSQNSNASHTPYPQTRTPVKSHGEAMSFTTGPGMSFSAQPQIPMAAAQMSPPGSQMASTPFRSFNASGTLPAPSQYAGERPQIYTAVYSGVKVYEMEINGVACMRRRADGCLNATQILKVAGVDKGKRTKVLEKEILPGEHEKVQGGYGKYQGTWISFERGREFCRQYGVEEVLRPLLDYDRAGDGADSGETQETPTKEQAMAANRKRLYNSSFEQRAANGVQGGTFFSNISPATSVALTAMEKAAQLNGAASRTSIPLGSGLLRPQSQQLHTQPSMVSEGSFSGEMSLDSAFGGTTNGDDRPRKRSRLEGDASMIGDMSIQMATDTSSSFPYHASAAFPETDQDGAPLTLSPLPAPDTQDAEDRRNTLLDLFADQTRTDYSNHPAMTQLDAQDYDLPLDASANTALHWAATLARLPLVRLLLQKGANMWRGNAAGQSALISAVTVNNCSEHSCFPQLLEMLAPLIEARDAVGKTILHHIAVSCGIKGRAPSSKYYLEALLEFLVRSKSHPSVTSTPFAAAPVQGSRPPVDLMRFLSTVVNAQDKGGNTALNLVARIGNRPIIQQFLEIRADPTVANHKGVSAQDFGIGIVEAHPHATMSFSDDNSQLSAVAPQLGHSSGESNGKTRRLNSADLLEEQNQEVISSLTSMLQTNLQNHKTLLRQKVAQIDALTTQIQELSSQQALEQQRFSELRDRVRLREEREKKIENLSRLIGMSQGATTAPSVGSADKQLSSKLNIGSLDTAALPSLNALQLRGLLRAYKRNNAALETESFSLKSQSRDLEMKYRRVISLCTNVADDQIDAMLPGLVAAVESENAAAGLNTLLHVQGNGLSATAGPQRPYGHQQQQDPSGTMAHEQMAGNDYHGSYIAAQPQDAEAPGMPALGVGRVREFLALVEGVTGNGGASDISPALLPSDLPAGVSGVGSGADMNHNNNTGHHDISTAQPSPHRPLNAQNLLLGTDLVGGAGVESPVKRTDYLNNPSGSTHGRVSRTPAAGTELGGGYATHGHHRRGTSAISVTGTAAGAARPGAAGMMVVEAA